jgi:hypothetical protein
MLPRMPPVDKEPCCLERCEDSCLQFHRRCLVGVQRGAHQHVHNATRVLKPAFSAGASVHSLQCACEASALQIALE